MYVSCLFLCHVCSIAVRWIYSIRLSILSPSLPTGCLFPYYYYIFFWNIIQRNEWFTCCCCCWYHCELLVCWCWKCKWINNVSAVFFSLTIFNQIDVDKLVFNFNVTFNIYFGCSYKHQEDFILNLIVNLDKRRSDRLFQLSETFVSLKTICSFLFENFFFVLALLRKIRDNFFNLTDQLFLIKHRIHFQWNEKFPMDGLEIL